MLLVRGMKAHHRSIKLQVDMPVWKLRRTEADGGATTLNAKSTEQIFFGTLTCNLQSSDCLAKIDLAKKSASLAFVPKG